MKFAVLAVCVTAIALGACRREEPVYQPMKLGSSVAQPAGN